jgi:hypothetical protein
MGAKGSQPAEGAAAPAPAAAAPAASGGSSWGISKLWGGGEQEEKNELCPTLTFRQRIYGFFGCLLLGFFFNMLSWMAMFQDKWTHYGVLMTCSNLSAIGGSMFLSGPKKQIQRMFEETRIIATIVYLVSMILTVVAAFTVKSPPLVITLSIIQYLAMIWYGLSYIPYARTVVKSCFKSMV